MTIHYESIEALVRGAEYQDANAANARQTAERLAVDIEHHKQRLADLTPQLTAAEQAALDAERLAADFRQMAAEYCKRNKWDMPEPTPAEQTRPDGEPVDAVKAALAEEETSDE